MKLPPELKGLDLHKASGDTLTKMLSLYFYKLMGAAQSLRVLSSMSEANYNEQKDKGHIVEWPNKQEILRCTSV